MLGRDPIGKFVEHAELGQVEQRVKLTGSLRLDDGGQAAAELCLMSSGVFLVAARSATSGVARRLTKASDIRLEGGRMSNELRIEGQPLGIPGARRRKAERLLALGQVRNEGARERGSASPVRAEGLLVDSPTELEEAWLTNNVASDEVVLAWLRTASARNVPSWLMESTPASYRLLLTVKRFQAVAISRYGDSVIVDLDPREVKVDEVRGRVTLVHGGQVISSARGKAAAFRRLMSAVEYQGAARVLEAARLNFAHGEAHLDVCQSLLTVARRHGEPRASFAAYLIAQETNTIADVDLAASLGSLTREGVAADALMELLRDWGFKAASGQALVTALRGLGGAGEPWALELHLYLHEAARNRVSDPSEAARADIELADHLFSVNERQRAVELLEARLHRLPRETLAEVLPPRDADLTRGAGGQTLRTRIFELLAAARGDGSKSDVHAVTELARLHPLVPARMRGLASLADDDLRCRARAVLSLLDPESDHAADPPAPLADSVRPLSDKLINEVLRHPASRADSPLLAKLQELLAAAPKPDVGMLRDYCEELSADTNPEAVTALREASRALGTRVRAYVSRGAKGVGLRAYENDTSFILIGGQHLVDGTFKMTRAELQFAIGAELAHLRFGHVRVTSNEVWAGALEKGQQGLDLALGVLPVLRGWKLADKAAKVTSRVPIPIVRRMIDATTPSRLLRRGVRPATAENEGVITTLNEQLVVAHRVMQLSADRAGLLLAQDIRPALRAMLLIRRDYRAEIPSMERRGLANVLGMRTEDGHMSYQDLAVRIAALLSFYLSDEFVRLRAALYD